VGEGDVIVTGEIRHHDALRIERVGAAAIALSHWSSERPTLPVLGSRLAAAVAGVDVIVSEADHEPFARV
jgi:putative NIF3 family GTP cyclohydrolase 1 type 2